MWQIFALFICCLFPSAFCLIAAWVWATPESVLAGTIFGGAVGVVTAINVLQ